MSKRINGEGMVRKHPTRDLYEARYTFNDPVTGARKRGSVYGKTAKEALANLEAVKTRLKDNKPPKDSKLTVSAWSDRWMKTTLEHSDRKESTKETYRFLTKSHIQPAPFGDLELASVRPSNIDALLQSMKIEGYSESTIRNLYAVLNAILDGARRDHLIASNPMREVPRPRVTKKKLGTLNLKLFVRCSMLQAEVDMRTSSDSFLSPACDGVKHSACNGQTSTLKRNC